MEGLFAMGVVKPESFHAALATTKGTKENMKALIFTLAVAIFPCAAQAGEAVTYMVDGETFEGYRAAASGDAKGLVPDHPRLGRSNRIRDEAGRHAG
jgi:hypothetical protein